MDVPHPIETAVAAVTEYHHTGRSDLALTAPHVVGPPTVCGCSYRYDSDLLTGLVGMAAHLVQRVAELEGSDRETVLRAYALDIAERVVITGA